MDKELRNAVKWNIVIDWLIHMALFFMGLYIFDDTDKSKIGAVIILGISFYYIVCDVLKLKALSEIE